VGHLGLVEVIDGLGESIVIGISDAAGRTFNASYGQALYGFDLAVC
jgi:hypothetical protein